MIQKQRCRSCRLPAATAIISEFKLPSTMPIYLPLNANWRTIWWNYFRPKNKNEETYKLASNWTMTDVCVSSMTSMLRFRISDYTKELSHMINLIIDGTISARLRKMFSRKCWKRMTTEAIVGEGSGTSKRCRCNWKVIDEILATNQGQVEQYKSGKQQVFGFFVGQTMKAMKGKANPKVVMRVLQRKLSSWATESLSFESMSHRVVGIRS